MITWFRRLSWPKRFLVSGGGLFLLLVVLGVVGYAATDVPAPNKIATDQSTRITYFSGTAIGTLGKNRKIVELRDVSLDAQRAVLSAEDRDFYSEPGISLKGIGRALFANVRAGGVQQGGSTITQQYAKNAFLTHERTFSRKIKEVFISIKMSQTVPKDTILADYLNTIYFGRGAYGIETAADTYFGVSAKNLTASQAAVLASSIRSPAGYDPARHPAKAQERWRFVLDGMVKKGWLTPADRARASYPKVLPRGAKASSFAGPLDYVREQVLAELADMGYPEDRVQAGGLTIKTTLDKKAELAAIQAMNDHLEKPAADDHNPPVGALVAVQPGTGRVIAYYGGRDPGGFDRASDGAVQPGSSMKPYVLATALEQGKSLSTRYPGRSGQDICGQKDVKNYEGDPAFGDIDLTTGLQYSVNVVYFRLACDVGPKNVRTLMRKAGLDDQKDKLDGEGVLSPQIALGSGGYEVRPIDQANGYATFAAGGYHATTHFVEAVCDINGHNCKDTKLHRDRAFSADVAADATSAMAKVVQAGTGTRAQLDGRPTAGKTGTTSKNTNAWFCGFTPNQLATAVWLGRPQGGTLKLPGNPNGVYGGTVPAKIFKQFMDAALEGDPVTQFPKKAGVGSPGTAPAVTSAPSATTTPSASPSTIVTTPPPPPTGVPTLLPSSPSPASPTASPSAQPSEAVSPRASSEASPP
ncbi:MAG: transglycosylase domain-containing protein [Mycobacteriales bacterium]